MSDYSYDYSYAHSRMLETYGVPIGEGRHRVVFRDGPEVIKVPTKDSGVDANRWELSTQGELYARTLEDPHLTECFGFAIIRAEFVEHTGESNDPDWTWTIDCGQVGLTAEGRLVAYDWDPY